MTQDEAEEKIVDICSRSNVVGCYIEGQQLVLDGFFDLAQLKQIVAVFEGYLTP